MRPRIVDVVPWVTSIRPVLTVVDPLAVVLAGLLVLPHVRTLPLAAAALAAALVCRGADLHRSRLVLSVLEDLPSLLLAALTATLVLGALNPSFDLERMQVAELAAFGGVAFAGMVLLRTGLYAATHVLRRSGLISHPVLIVGVGAIGRRLAEALLTRREYGLLPVGMVDCAAGTSLRGLPLPLVGGIDDLDRAMSDLGVDDVIFAFPGPPDQDTIAAVRSCVQHDRQVFVVPRFFELMGKDRHRRTELVRDIAVMRLHRLGIRWHTALVKRAIDVTVSLGGLLVLSPVLLLIAVAVRIETGPGVIFHQTRVGEGGRTFTLLKFRSLRPAAFEAGSTSWNIDNDSRIGPVGRFLRRTGLDELPQLVNVLRGEMSLVGPRPERPAYVEEFSRERHRYADRHRMPGGLTGWAQVNNLRGDTSIDDRVRFDNFYIEHWSLWSDVKIMARTLRTFFRRQPPDVRELRLTAPVTAPVTPPGATPPAGGTTEPGLALTSSRRG